MSSASTVARADAESHRVIGEKRPRMLKADLPKGETVDFLAEIGRCLDFARRMAGWTVDQLARELERDSKQVARWMRGEERTQVDVVFGVKELRGPFVIALAELADCEIETTVRIRRNA
jgi:ribosome-binding protein aMBF1 (putative translation factor)